MKTSGQIVNALATRHRDDIFVTELTPGQKGLRLDAWAMRRSWSPLTTIGYEVKITRADFLRDRKWEQYLPYAHEFYLVCPWKLIDPGELAPGVGLIWVTDSGLARCKFKAPRRPDPDLELVLARILIGHAQIAAAPVWDGKTARDRRLEFFRQWLEQKGEHRRLGYELGLSLAKMRDDLNYKMRAAEHKQRDLDARERRLAQREALHVGGLDPADLDAALGRLDRNTDTLQAALSRQMAELFQLRAILFTESQTP